MRKEKDGKCLECIHINIETLTDIGGSPIAKCMHPDGVKIGNVSINNDYVYVHGKCAKLSVKGLT